MPNARRGHPPRHAAFLLTLLLSPLAAAAEPPPAQAPPVQNPPAQALPVQGHRPASQPAALPASQPVVVPLTITAPAPVAEAPPPAPAKKVEALELPPSRTDHLLSKGRMYVALTFGLGSRKNENSGLLLEDGTRDADSLKFNILMPFAYQVADLFAVGLELSYEHDNLEQVRRVGGNESQLQRFAYRVGMGPFMRNYLRISPWGIFYLYVDTAVRFSIGEQIVDTQESGNRDKTLSQLYRLSAGIEPGLLAVLPQGFGFQVGINLIGVSVEWENGRKNYVEDSRVTATNVNFDVSLLSLRMSVLYHF